MEIFCNGVDVDSIEPINRGFLEALVSDAEWALKEDTPGDLGISEDLYDELCDSTFSVQNVDPETIAKCNKIVVEFLASPCLGKQREKLANMNIAAKIEFGRKLYDAITYDSSILGEEFAESVPDICMEPGGTIGESVYGDIRVFCN